MTPDAEDPLLPFTRPPVSSIPHFLKSPPPKSFPESLSSFQSTIPTEARIPRQPPLPDISLTLSITPTIYYHLIIRLYPKLPVKISSTEDLHAPSHPISITNLPVNRSVLHHALYGVLPQSPPHHPPLLHDILAANIHALSIILARAPSFVISLEPSPYFGITGLEARVIIAPTTTPNTSPPSYHLLGLSSPETHIPNLEFLLRQLCPEFKYRLLGVITNLTREQHNSPLGVTVSRTIAHFMRLAPKGLFVTPDEVLSPPPLTPVKLAALTKEHMAALVELYRPRLEHDWIAETFNRIIEDHQQLCKSQQASQTGGEGMLEHAWALVGEQYPNLRRFVAVLTTAFAYKPPVRTKIPITCPKETDPFFAAEFVLQARQFVLLRRHLVP